MIRAILMSTALAFTTLSAAAPALAQDELRTERVSYADLNLASPAGAAAFEGRVRRAISHVCDMGGDQSLSSMLEAGRCTSRARAGVKLQMAQVYASSGVRPSSTSIILAAR